MSKMGKKKNFTEREMEVLLSEVEARKKVLFGTLKKTFHTLCTGLLTFAHRDDQGLVRKILNCSLTSKKQQVTNFNHQLVMML